MNRERWLRTVTLVTGAVVLFALAWIVIDRAAPALDLAGSLALFVLAALLVPGAAIAVFGWSGSRGKAALPVLLLAAGLLLSLPAAGAGDVFRDTLIRRGQSALGRAVESMRQPQFVGWRQIPRSELPPLLRYCCMRLSSYQDSMGIMRGRFVVNRSVIYEYQPRDLTSPMDERVVVDTLGPGWIRLVRH